MDDLRCCSGEEEIFSLTRTRIIRLDIFFLLVYISNDEIAFDDTEQEWEYLRFLYQFLSSGSMLFFSVDESTRIFTHCTKGKKTMSSCNEAKR